MRQRLEAGKSLAEVARWLYLGPAAERASTAVFALKGGSGLELAACTEAIDEVIAEVDPQLAQLNLELRIEFFRQLEELADEQGGDEQASP